MSSFDMIHSHVTHECICEMYQWGHASLMWAALFGRLPVVEYLVEKGTDVDTKEHVSNTVISCDATHVTLEHICEYISGDLLR